MLRSPHFRFFFPRAEQQNAEALREELEARYPAMVQALGQGTGERIDVYLFATYEAFEKATGGEVDPWVIGLARPDLQRVYLPPQASPSEAQKVAKHEVAHVLLGQAVGGTSVPRWWTEGVAKYLSHDFTVADRERLEQAARQSSWLPLTALEEDFPHDPNRAHLAYAESYTFVAFLIDHFGSEAVARLNGSMRSGEAFSGALKAAFAVEETEIQEEWFTYLRDKYRRQALWGSTDGLIFLAITLLFLWAAIRRWQRRRQAEEADPSEEEEGEPRIW